MVLKRCYWRGQVYIYIYGIIEKSFREGISVLIGPVFRVNAPRSRLFRCRGMEKKKKKKKDKKIRRDENLARGGYEEEEKKKERGLFIKELPRLGSAGGIFFEEGWIFW